MRVLQVYKDYWPVYGGMENHIRWIAEGMRERHPDIAVEVLVTSLQNRTTDERINGIRVVKAARLMNLQSAPISPALVRELRRIPSDIVHLHFPYPIGELAYLAVAQKRKCVLTYHSDIVRQKALGTLYRPFWHKILLRADVICVSNPNYIQTSEHLRPHAAKCKVIPHGIPLGEMALTPAVEARAAALRQEVADGPIFLFVGMLRHYKGLHVLIDAMRNVPAGTAIIAGDGPLRDALLAQTAAAGLQQRVRFVGRIDDAEKRAWLEACDLFCMPGISRAESWGISMVEALACGKPAISTEVGTGTSWVNRHNETGLVVTPSDPAELANAINQLAGDATMRERMGERARAWAAEQLDVRTMIDRYAGVYRGLVPG